MNGSRATPPGTPAIDDLQARYRRELFDEVLPFWDRHGVDHELGGVMCALDVDGAPANTHKLLWFQGRSIWVYSRLYGAFGRQARWLTIARQAVEFSLRHLRQPDGSWAELVTREGTVIGEAGPPPRFGPFFMAEGLQEFAAATGDAAMHDLARNLLIASCREATASNRIQQPAWFLTLLVCTQMLARRPDPELDALAARAEEAILTDHYNHDTGLNDEVAGPGARGSARDAGFTIFGHSIEALWMVLDAAVRRNDAAVVDRCAARIHRHLDVGWDRVFGGLCHAVRVGAGAFEWPVERPVGTGLEFRFTGEYHYMKTFWSLAEALVAVLKVLEQRPGAGWAGEWFRRIQHTLDERFSLRAHGAPFYTLFADRRFECTARVPRQDNYHHPRMLMFALKSLEAMRAAGVRAI